MGRGHWLAGLVALPVRRLQEGVEATLPCPQPSLPTTRRVVVIVAAVAASAEEAKAVKPIGGNEGRQSRMLQRHGEEAYAVLSPSMMPIDTHTNQHNTIRR